MRKAIIVSVVTTAATVVLIVAALRQWKRRKDWQWKKTQRILRNFARDSATPVSKLWQVADAMVSNMEASLISSDGDSTTLNMQLVSNVASLPTGEEEGLYYGVNLRGTNFLILSARLGGKSNPISDLKREEIMIPSNLMASPLYQDLFDFIAVEVSKFLSPRPGRSSNDTASKTKENKVLGFTVSYPVDQAEASLEYAIKWKCFSADDTVGKDLVTGINQALVRHGVQLHVSTLVDETVGVLAGGRYYNKDCVAAVTLATGTNASYVEPTQVAAESNGSLSPRSPQMATLLQWGNFCSSYLPITEFDACLDAQSSSPGSKMYEKLMSGMYLGETVRRVLLKMAQETALFGDSVPSKLMTPYTLRSPDMAAMQQDTSEDREVVSEKLKEIFGIANSTPMAREVVAEVCDIVSERGSRLAGAGIVGIIKKLGRIENKRSIVSVEGGVYEHYRVFRNYLNSCVWEMLGNDYSNNLGIELSHAGSGTGALFLAAAAESQNSR